MTAQKIDQSDEVVRVLFSGEDDAQAVMTAYEKAVAALDRLNANRKGKSKLQLPIKLTFFNEDGDRVFEFSTLGDAPPELSVENFLRSSTFHYVVAIGACGKKLTVRIEWERVSLQ